MMPEARVAQPVTATEAERLARDYFALNATATPLPGEYDDNFHLHTPGGDHVLKVMHPARDLALVDLQVRALRHLNASAPQMHLPRVCPATSGDPISTVRLVDGSARLAWLLTWVPGTVLAEVKPHSTQLMESLGETLGRVDTALATFTHPAATRELKWDLSRAAWIRDYIHFIPDPLRRKLVEHFLEFYECALHDDGRRTLPEGRVRTNTSLPFPSLRRGIIYADANDYNVLVGHASEDPRTIGLIDFGDMHHGLIVSEPAIAAAYAILGKEDPLAAATAIVRGFHRAFSLTEDEIATLYTFIAMRLAVSVVNSAHRKTLHPDDNYVTITEAPAWEALERWSAIHPRFAHYTFRDACGFTPVPNHDRICNFLRNSTNACHSEERSDKEPLPSRTNSPIRADLRSAIVLDLSIGSTFLGADPRALDTATLTESIFRHMRDTGAAVAIGRYDEARPIYTSSVFGGDNPLEEHRTVHLGIDLFAEPGTPIRAPLDGIVHTLSNNTAPLDYGPLVILEHATDNGDTFFTLYGHLSEDTLPPLRVGQRIKAGEAFARIGAPPTNGNWPPHLHLQIMLDLLELDAGFPGVAYASQRNVWTSLSPNPNLLLRIPEERFPATPADLDATIEGRRRLLGHNLSLSYHRPLKIVRGWMQYLYDDTGRAYLDMYNNVPIVGHSHPRVVRAIQEQVALLNTNTRYLHENAIRYAERLTALLPEPLRVCYFVNSGSEANELALRMARAHTGREDVIVLDHAYHGHTNTLIDISPYKFNGPGGRGRKPWVHVAPLPDDYRGTFRRDDAQAGAKYAHAVLDILNEISNGCRTLPEGRVRTTDADPTIGITHRYGPAAFIAETLPSVAGQIVLPPGYLRDVYRYVRTAGGVCIADEVQVGFGRLGTHFWGFESQDVVPDIVVLGKPIGNAFPLAAVVATREIAASFDNGMEFFSTFGGNPVACAAGLAVLDVIRDEHLQEHALSVGTYLLDSLRALQYRYPLLGDIRGSGLFLGLDLVLDRDTREPAPRQADYVVNRLRECGILTGTDGPHHNVVKLRPPLVLTEADADRFVSTLADILDEDGVAL